MSGFRFVLVAVVLLAPGWAFASGMRCGKHLVLEGYSFDKVSRLCGEADSAYQVGEKYIQHAVRNDFQEAAIAEVVRVDKWVYRGSETQFTRNLYFENGVLVRIELDGR